MERWLRDLARLPQQVVGSIAAALCAVLLAAALGAALLAGSVRASSLAAAGALLAIVGVGLYLYAWRLGTPGRSE